MAVARALAQGGRDETGDAATAFGLDPAMLPIARPIEIWPENVAAVELWCMVQTQWRWGPTGEPTGLDYAGVLAAMDAAGIADRRGMMAAIRIMEWETLRVMRNHHRAPGTGKIR